jgi:hypothetical protein
MSTFLAVRMGTRVRWHSVVVLERSARRIRRAAAALDLTAMCRVRVPARPAGWKHDGTHHRARALLLDEAHILTSSSPGDPARARPATFPTAQARGTRRLPNRGSAGGRKGAERSGDAWRPARRRLLILNGQRWLTAHCRRGLPRIIAGFRRLTPAHLRPRFDKNFRIGKIASRDDGCAEREAAHIEVSTLRSSVDAASSEGDELPSLQVATVGDPAEA